MGTLSKAVGSYGGYVCGSQTLIDYLKTAARSLIYSTGSAACALLPLRIAALKIMQADRSWSKSRCNMRGILPRCSALRRRKAPSCR